MNFSDGTKPPIYRSTPPSGRDKNRTHYTTAATIHSMQQANISRS